MLVLTQNGQPFAVGDDALWHEFEEHVVRWRDKESGWDADGVLWAIRELPDRPEFEDSRDTLPYSKET